MKWYAFRFANSLMFILAIAFLSAKGKTYWIIPAFVIFFCAWLRICKLEERAEEVKKDSTVDS